MDSGKTPRLFVLSGPSGVGKTTLAQAVMDNDDNLQRAITHTSRPPRDSEINGVHYHFVDEAEFLRMREGNEFLETVHIFGNYYGTSRQAVLDRLGENTDTMLIIDWQGARYVRDTMDNVTSIFIVPPSVDTLQERLVNRAEGEAKNDEVRVQIAKSEIQHYVEYDFVIINEFFDTTVEQLHLIIDGVRNNCTGDVGATPKQVDEILADR